LRVVVGLGNPGSRYALTRHNAGFLFADSLAQELGLQFLSENKLFLYAQGSASGTPFCIIKPQTYMNLSGEALLYFLERYQLEPADFLICYDDIALPLGTVKLKLNGGDGGHNGLTSIIEHLQTTNFPRLRLGVGNNFAPGGMVEYVLGKFSENELFDLKLAFTNNGDLAKAFIDSGVKGLADANSRKST